MPVGRTHVEVGGDSDDGVGDLLTEVRLGDLLHLAKNHGRDLLGSELLLGASDINLNNGLAILVDDLVGEVLEISLDILVVKLATDEAPATVSRVLIIVDEAAYLTSKTVL